MPGERRRAAALNPMPWLDGSAPTADSFSRVIFLSLVGERFDGHHFLAQLPELKVQAAVVSRSWTEPLPSGLLHWRVDDTLLAYQQLALLHRRVLAKPCLLYTSPSPRDYAASRMPSSA